MNEQEEASSGFILPIQCPKCGEHVELSIDFSLLPPKDENYAITEEDTIS